MMVARNHGYHSNSHGLNIIFPGDFLCNNIS